MNNKMLIEIEKLGCDIKDAIERMMDDEEMIAGFIKRFYEDDSMIKLGECMQQKNYKDSFEYAHTIKGLAVNLGLTNIYMPALLLSDRIRQEDYENIEQHFSDLKINYEKVKNIVDKFN